MNVIIDSGSTKSKWVLFDSEIKETISISGLNPYYQTSEEIHLQIKKELEAAFQSMPAISSISFYGAGCEEESSKEVIKKGLRKTFPNAEIIVEHDLLAAARSLLGNTEGIACIAGTGSNSCYFDGKTIIRNIYSPGLALGDEGSGGYLGKLLVLQYIRENLPLHLKKSFEEFTSDRTPQILEKVYKMPFPNRYLASFALFVIQNQKDPYLYKLAYKNFADFFDNCILPYENAHKLSVCFIGSVAYHLSDILKTVAHDKKINLDKIESDPMKGLIHYHFAK